MPQVTKRIEPHRRLGLSSTPTIRHNQKASAAYIKGAPVYIDSNGFVAACTVDTVSANSCIKAAASQSILGFAQEAGASSASDTSKVGVTPALPGMMFKGQLVDSTSNAIVASQMTDVGANMGLCLISGDTMYGVDKGVASSRDCVQVLELIDDSGTTGGQVGFVVRAGWRQLDL
jgi:hypothetical protein